MNLLAQLPSLSLWQNFYVITGSSAGALVGLQFVVMALIANARRQADSQAIDAFGTPNVVHFSGALTISAVASAPWPSLFSASVTLAICGLLGLIYGAIVFRRARRQTGYKPVAEDWLWYVILPCAMYAVLTAAAFTLRIAGQVGFFVVAGVTLGLLLLGIRNAWDTVTHIVSGGDQANTDAPTPTA